MPILLQEIDNLQFTLESAKEGNEFSRTECAGRDGPSRDHLHTKRAMLPTQLSCLRLIQGTYLLTLIELRSRQKNMIAKFHRNFQFKVYYVENLKTSRQRL